MIARNSVFTYKGKAVKVQQVAEDLLRPGRTEMAQTIIFGAQEMPVLPRYNHPEVLAVQEQVPDDDLIWLYKMVVQMLLPPE